MFEKFPLHESSIEDIYFESGKRITYIIPIYQRNYAWEEDEISTLVKDVVDSFKKDPGRPYYIGTLVTYSRSDDEYEVIDGQQRLTTIYLVLHALGETGFTNKLTYSARKVSADTLYKLPDKLNGGDTGIINGFEYAEKAIEQYVDKNEKDAFMHYFLNNVKLIHYDVPKDVDLNHYFEVMNSRGEQLEKHEIVKSLLGQNLKDRELATFSRVWDAVSDMGNYIHFKFNESSVFGRDYYKDTCSFLINGFEEIPQSDPTEGKRSILDLMKGEIFSFDSNKNEDAGDRFQPIIDFPNFLLIVLKLTLYQSEKKNINDLSLDDKELLTQFQDALGKAENKREFTLKFAFNLLRSKYFLDNYIVHHTVENNEKAGDNPWQLKLFFSGREDNSANVTARLELVHLLSAFEVSFSAKQRKNYLFYLLLHLFEDGNEENYLDYTRRLADKYFFDVYLNKDCLNERNLPVPNAFDRIILEDPELDKTIDRNDVKERFEKIYQKGIADVPLFVFNYMDYRIWKKYADEMRGNKLKVSSESRKEFFKELGCSDFGLEPFDNFYFSRTRKTLEHYYPRAKARQEGDLDYIPTLYDLNCFGNFAMIGAAANSSGSNWDPKTKLTHYIDRKSDQVGVASLKFRIMMQICRDNDKKDRLAGLEWNLEDMKYHQGSMLKLLED